MNKNKKLLVIVPFRDRESHLKQFVPHITETLQHKNIDHKILVIEQSQEKLFNRGLLCNIGFDLFKDDYDYFCFHDVDMLPKDVDYSYVNFPTNLCGNWTKHTDLYSLKFCNSYFGGVTLFPKEDFIKINGFSNGYWGWGAEDDDLKLRCSIMNIETKQKSGDYIGLNHPTIIFEDRLEKSPGYKTIYERWNTFKDSSLADQIKHISIDGLHNSKNFYTTIKTIPYTKYTLIQVYTK